ncbi:WXG100 family type VII secretion target [Prauserella oleivorans]|uniref:WXG100 family type VII secretion target n=1 Tax=Prauserella oleivorans TaxID=1478153 RepID=A0ABW5W505_9PSEU
MVFTNMEPDKLTAGTGPIDTVYQAAKDINNPEDWAVDGLALGLDALGFIANPLGALAGSVVGFLIEHLEFLKEPLDDLAGDPDAIFAVAAVWGEQVSKECVQIADDYQRAIESEIGSWNGDAAEAYRGKSGQIVEQIRSLEAAAVGVSQAVQGSGQAVATVRGIIRDLIADVVGEILVAAAAAVASSWFTLGGSLAAFTGWAVARGAATAGKIAGKISKLLMKLATILNKFSKLRGAVQALGKLARKFGDTARSMGQLAGRHGSALRQVDGTVGGWNEAITGSLPSGLRGLADNVDDAMAKRLRDGFADTMSPENLARVGLYEGAKEHANADENYDDAVKKQNEQ